MLRSDLCYFSDAYIVVKGNITVTKKTFTTDDIDAPNDTAANVTATNTANNNAFGEKKLIFENNAPFINCIAKFMENGVTHDNLTKNDVEIVVPLKHLSNFRRNLDIPLINCEVELILTWFKNCVLIDKSTREANYGANPVVYEIDNPKDATFKITYLKLFVPVVTLSKENDIQLLEQLKQGLKEQ